MRPFWPWGKSGSDAATVQSLERKASDAVERAFALAGRGDCSEALECNEEAVEAIKALMKKRFDPFDARMLAAQLYLQASLLPRLGRTAEGIYAARSSLGLYQELGKADPTTYGPLIADVQGRLSLLLSAVGQAYEAEEHGVAAIAFYRHRAAIDPRHRRDLARELVRRSDALDRVGAFDRSLNLRTEAVELYRSLADQLDACDAVYFAGAAVRLSQAYLKMGRIPEAASAARDAVEQARAGSSLDAEVITRFHDAAIAVLRECQAAGGPVEQADALRAATAAMLHSVLPRKVDLAETLRNWEPEEER